MLITSNFDSGNITAVKADDPSDIQLTIDADSGSEFLQWFHFRLSGVAGEALTCKVLNAGDAAYTEGFDGYSVCASYDRENWFRIETSNEDGVLSWSLDAEFDSVYFAYFAPFSMERHLDLIADVSLDERVSATVLGHTLDGQAMDLVTIGHGPKKVWLIARQHPGETMAEFWMEGALERLLDHDDPTSKALLEKATFYIVPNMNPDGSRRGHLRCNAVGANLNREWAEPTMERSPEVYLVREKMHSVGVDFHLDVHGDEALPYNFIAGYEAIPSLTDEHLAKQHRYTSILDRISPDFQTVEGYDIDPPKSSDLKKCTEYVAESFGALAMTLEMPFKDNANAPDALFGWSPERCRHLGRDCLAALHEMIDEI